MVLSRTLFLLHPARVLVDKLIPDFEPSHRSAYSAKIARCSLVIDESDLANWRQNPLDSFRTLRDL